MHRDTCTTDSQIQQSSCFHGNIQTLWSRSEPDQNWAFYFVLIIRSAETNRERFCSAVRSRTKSSGAGPVYRTRNRLNSPQNSGAEHAGAVRPKRGRKPCRHSKHHDPLNFTHAGSEGLGSEGLGSEGSEGWGGLCSVVLCRGAPPN